MNFECWKLQIRQMTISHLSFPVFLNSLILEAGYSYYQMNPTFADLPSNDYYT